MLKIPKLWTATKCAKIIAFNKARGCFKNQILGNNSHFIRKLLILDMPGVYVKIFEDKFWGQWTYKKILPYISIYDKNKIVSHSC